MVSHGFRAPSGPSGADLKPLGLTLDHWQGLGFNVRTIVNANGRYPTSEGSEVEEGQDQDREEDEEL